MRVALSTRYRPARAGAREIVARLVGLGAEEIAIDPTLPDELAQEVMQGSPVAAIEWRGRARLCAEDREERAAAVAAAERALRRAGAGICVVALGATPVAWEEAEVARRFGRDQWSAARVLEERRAVAAAHVDAVRFALERLIPVAERESARLAITTRARAEWFQLGARAADACGLFAPLAPGLGEVDFATIGKLPLAVIEGNGTDEEIRRAVRLLA